MGMYNTEKSRHPIAFQNACPCHLLRVSSFQDHFEGHGRTMSAIPTAQTTGLQGMYASTCNHR
ncbi:hypothetical protein Mapa_015465 [Marchantia paleacea]|nr:hypothetical protein Mapa_015465 [Marchantia paleacea]